MNRGYKGRSIVHPRLVFPDFMKDLTAFSDRGEVLAGLDYAETRREDDYVNVVRLSGRGIFRADSGVGELIDRIRDQLDVRQVERLDTNYHVGTSGTRLGDF